MTKDGGELCKVSWIFGLISASGSLPRPRDVPGFGLPCVYVDGVRAVGCNRQKVLAAMDAVKAALDTAGLQCSEVEADVTRQVFTGLQLNHETVWLSLDASRIWRPPCCVVLHCRSSMLGTGLRKRLVRVVVNCGQRSHRNSGGLPRCCRFSVAALPVHCHLGFKPRMPQEGHVVAMASRAVGAISGMLRRQGGVLSDGGFLLRSLLALCARCYWKVSECGQSSLAWSPRRTRT